MYLRNRLFSSGLVAIVGLSFMFVSPDLLAQGSLFQQKKNASLENQDVKVNASESDVKDLFMQTKSVSIQFTPQSGTLSLDKSSNQEYYISERNGYINLDFMLAVPQGFLTSKGRLTLLPKIQGGDTLITMPGLMLKGEAFFEKQQKDYEAYNRYLSSIVDKSQYDSVFLDRPGISKDIDNRRSSHYTEYKNEWSKQVEFEKWEKDKKEKDIKLSAKQAGERKMLYHQYVRKAQDQAMRYLTQGKDTTGIWAKHMAEFEKKAPKLPEDPAETIQKAKQLEEKDVPDRYKDIYTSGRSVSDIKNNYMTDRDSLEILKKRYNFDKISENEMRAKRRDEVFKELVPFPYEDKKSMVVDTMVSTFADYTYRYRKDIPVKPGTSTMQLMVDGRVNAIDRSEFKLGRSNVLSFTVTSLSDLADASLSTKRWTVDRNVTKKIVSDIKFAKGSSTFEASLANNRTEASKIISEYNAIKGNPEFILDSIVLISKCSLEGDFAENERLSQQRAQSLKKLLAAQQVAGLEQLLVARSLGEDWQAFEKAVQNEESILNGAQIVSLIYNVGDPDNCEERIRNDYPEDYRVIVNKIYPTLSKFDVVYYMHREQTGDINKEEVLPGYTEGLQDIKDWKYAAAYDKLKPYTDYNTALCLAGMNKNREAYKLLDELETRTAKSEYLLAIVSCRMGRNDDAVPHILAACRMDPALISRIKMDVEISSLVDRYNLGRQIKIAAEE